MQDNRGGSYLTMLSKSGFIFGIINIVGNFGTVFIDQSYWQSAIAAKPSATYKGYILGGLCAAGHLCMFFFFFFFFCGFLVGKAAMQHRCKLHSCCHIRRSFVHHCVQLQAVQAVLAFLPYASVLFEHQTHHSSSQGHDLLA